MTPPKPGDIFERDGKRREVVEVEHVGNESGSVCFIYWRKPGVDSYASMTTGFGWRRWASKAKLVQEAVTK